MISPKYFLALYFSLLRLDNIVSISLAVKGNGKLSLKSARCGLLVSIGRIPGSAMPPEWASSGAQLALKDFELEFQDEESDRTENLLGKGIQKVVKPINLPTFISMKGEQTVNVKEGAYFLNSIEDVPTAYDFRFFLDFPDGAARNDVVLPAERVFFTSKCWMTDESIFSKVRAYKEEIETEIKEIQEELEKRNSSKGAGMVRGALGFRDSVILVEGRQQLEKNLARLYQSFPLDESNTVCGPNGFIFEKQGYVSVKRSGGFLGLREEYHWVGRYSITDFVDAAI